jgi:hypothetical protein
MNISINGIVFSTPKPADDKRITFLLFRGDTGTQISCLSSLNYDSSISLKQGDSAILNGSWIPNIPPSQPMVFRFDSASIARSLPS